MLPYRSTLADLSKQNHRKARNTNLLLGTCASAFMVSLCPKTQLVRSVHQKKLGSVLVAW